MSLPSSGSGPLARLRLRLDEPSPAGVSARLLALALPLAMLTAVLATAVAAEGAVVATGIFALIAAMAVAGLRSGYEFPRLGLCNMVTLGRAALASSLVAPLAAASPLSDTQSSTIVVIASIALALDGVDGWLARRDHLASAFGARFDMEIDAALGLILSLLVVDAGTLGPWVLALGIMRYVYVAAGFALPWLNGPLPAAWRRKAICVVQIAALIVLNAPVVAGWPAVALAVAAIAALGWSFAVDIVWLYQRRSS